MSRPIPPLTIQQIAEKYQPSGRSSPKSYKEGWMICCPAHPGDSLSAAITPNSKDPSLKPGLHCWAGCSQEAIIAVLRVNGHWFWDQKKERKAKYKDKDLIRKIFKRPGKGQEPWYYTDLNPSTGQYEWVGRVYRFDLFTEEGTFVKKSFSAKKYNKNGKTNDQKWTNAGNSFKWPLYNKEKCIEKAKAGKVIFSLEGEKKIDHLEELNSNFAGFTQALGCSNAKGFMDGKPEEVCKGAQYVAIIPDYDMPGMAFALFKARYFFKHKIPVKILWLPRIVDREKPLEESHGQGFDDWCTKYNGTAQELIECAELADFWQPEEGDIDLVEEAVIERPPVQAEPVKPKKTEQPPRSLTELNPEKYALTEEGNAQFFVRKYLGQVYWLTDKKQWAIWCGTHFLLDEGEKAKQLVNDSINEMIKSWYETGLVEPDRIPKWRQSSLSASGKNNLLNLAKGWLKNKYDNFNKLKWHLNLSNGVSKLDTGERLDHDPKYLFTYCLDHLKWFPIDSEDPEAAAPDYIKYLNSVFEHDKSQIPAVLRLVAMGLTGDCRWRKWVMLQGDKGREGKSTLVKPLYWILNPAEMCDSGRKALICRIDHESKFSDPGNLKGMRAYILDEVGKRDELDNEKIKSLTGNEPIQGSRLYQDGKGFLPTHTIYCFGNKKPRWDVGDDLAAQERLILIKFVRHFEEHEQDLELDEKLQKQLSGILRILTIAAMDLAAIGPAPHPAFTAAKTEYINEQDIFGEFVEECFLKFGETKFSDIYTVFKIWSKDEGHQHAWSRKRVGMELANRGFAQYKNGDGERVYQGLDINVAYRKRARLDIAVSEWATRN